MERFQNYINQSLSLYSIFGYLLPGFFLTSLLIVDYDLAAILRKMENNSEIKLETIKSLDLKIYYLLDFFSTGTLSDFKFIPFILFLFFCYLIGHVVSAFASLFIERLFVRFVFGYPSSILMKGGDNPKWPILFGSYRRPFNSQMIREIKDEVKKVFEFDVNSKDYYWLLYSYIITTRPYLAPRVHHFVNLYGFSRNVCATFLFYIAFRFLFLDCLAGSKMDWASWSIMGLFSISSFLLFYNYLKLFKRQAVDVYYLFLSIKHDSRKNDLDD
ncbi:hypothetical protein [uncultured Algoriphagus sp.]|uniref:hypothetical protein n=1 Tax=uncultured Algoriphagus sp. TaxID=417365 RepID=UPI00258D0B23|nr:hypothetical protein [uncultured Algoriphagus sp.]